MFHHKQIPSNRRHRGPGLASLLAACGLTLALGLAACGGNGIAVDDDAKVGDAKVGDAEISDASTADASTVTDNDHDHDGYKASEDCDDNDDQIYPGVIRSCQSDCASGIEICLATGDWLACDARADCDCTTPGAERTIACGMCGTATQECGLDLKWSLPASCNNEGECHPTESQQDDCETCGTRTRGCTAQCEWEPWDTSACFGDCAPGEEFVDNAGCSDPWLYAKYQCDSTTCEYNTIVDCTDDCFLAARTDTATDFKADVCIPGGPFIMGSDPGEGEGDEERPEHTVNLSPYFIDKYEVTVARYRECVLAGGCLAPEDVIFSNYYDAGSEIFPINEVTWFEARTFCEWDSRHLPTEAQWEKAARGRTPSESANPWGDSVPTCLQVPCSECGQPGPVPGDSHPAGASPFGVMHLGSNLREWVNDYWDADYYSISPAMDPTGPVTGTARVRRGGYFAFTLQEHSFMNTWRTSAVGDTSMSSLGFRCARHGIPE